MQPHLIQVDYNQRDSSGTLLRAKVPAIRNPRRGDKAVVYEPQDHTEADAVIESVRGYSAEHTALVEGRWTKWLIVHLAVDLHTLRDMHACTSACDSDCEEEYCHEGHHVPWKREAGHPWLRKINGEESVYP